MLREHERTKVIFSNVNEDPFNIFSCVGAGTINIGIEANLNTAGTLEYAADKSELQYVASLISSPARPTMTPYPMNPASWIKI
jgi:hypothetical protein